MPNCQHCGEKWTYKEAITLAYRLSIGKPCPYCKKDNYIRKMRKRDVVLYLFILAFGLLVLPQLPVSMGWKITLIVLLFGTYLAIYPFNMSLSKEEEPFF